MSVASGSMRGVSLKPGGTVSPPPPFDDNWVPSGYKGPVALPGTGRVVWWTGRIAIGLRYAPKTAS
jgi:hypothetical protein